MTAIALADLVPFSTGCRQLGIPLPSAERYLRRRPHCLPPVHRVGWGRFFQRSDLERYAAEQQAHDGHLQAMAALLTLASPNQKAPDKET
jgi:hypothetical protein